MWMWSAVLLLWRVVGSSPFIHPPHCMHTSTLTAVSSQGASSLQQMVFQFNLALHTTVCFRVDEGGGNGTGEGRSSWLHTLTLSSIEQHHPVSSAYKFGIPEVQTSCKCDCEGSGECSAANYEYVTCAPEEKHENTGSSCYRTFHPNQPSTGCSTQSSNLCCQVTIAPHKNKTYSAVHIEQPNTFATFSYVAYDYVGGGWVQRDSKRLRIQMDGRAQDNRLDGRELMQLTVSAGGRTTFQLESGMYYATLNEGGEMEGVRTAALNLISDNDVHRLGWYRRSESGQFYVNNALIRVQSAVGAKVVDCKQQKFQWQFDANYFYPDHFPRSPRLEDKFRWIERAALYDSRNLVVSLSEGTSLHVALQLSKDEGGHSLLFLHNSSRIGDFSGSIIVDERSNRFLNLSVSQASGKLNGVIRASNSAFSPEVYRFTAYVHELDATNRSFVIPLPATVESGGKLVCVRAEETKEEEANCHVLPFHETPLQVDVEHNSWRELTGHCPECNKVGVKGFLKFMNPLSWFEGLQSTGESLLLLTDIFVYAVALVILYLFITKFLIPVCQCCVCPLLLYKLDVRGERRSEQRQQKRARVVDGQFV